MYLFTRGFSPHRNEFPATEDKDAHRSEIDQNTHYTSAAQRNKKGSQYWANGRASETELDKDSDIGGSELEVELDEDSSNKDSEPEAKRLEQREPDEMDELYKAFDKLPLCRMLQRLYLE